MVQVSLEGYWYYSVGFIMPTRNGGSRVADTESAEIRLLRSELTPSVFE